MPGIRPLAAAALAATLALALVGCTDDSLAEQYRAGDNKGYITADGRVQEIPDAERGEPVEFAGVTETGERFSSADVAGDVVVVNFWYAACGPCRVEAEDLESVWQEYQGQNVSFVGVNTLDQADTAQAFAETYGITYPSIIDVNEGSAKLAFAGATPINATPTTLVLDATGRVAARIVGQLDGVSTLSTLVGDALADSS
ncbi:TlpA family protein disulfide reductase [Microbacterium sp. DT81.1]|uniref:TlpA family protein disulfide reductase n=1 Tax=Microbacterium sp. DT81.1 TaxID=3393413 RepID=UPI003CFA75DD